MKEEKKFNAVRAGEEERLARLIQENAEDSFKPFFSSRVMSRLNANSAAEESFTRALAWMFRRVAVAAVILIVALAAYNISSQRALGNSRSPVEEALALPAVTIESSIVNFSLTDAL
jgi:anti-sigma-K factor RskA